MLWCTKYRSVLVLCLLSCCLATAWGTPRKAKKRDTTVQNNTTIASQEPFITREWLTPPKNGLAGRNIALWNSHGLYFDQKEYCWLWQRPSLFNTVEDLYTGTYTEALLIPMLENAGAFVITPREHDTREWECIVDAEGTMALTKGYKETNGRYKWSTSSPGFIHNNAVLQDSVNPFHEGTYRTIATVENVRDESTAQYWADIPERGDYAIYISYAPSTDAVSKVPYTVHTMGGDKHFSVNQTMGFSTWVYLGKFTFDEGWNKIVSVSNMVPGAHGHITTDAVKIGGGQGNVGRRPAGEDISNDAPWITSGKPRYTEGARYWMQWAGVPDSVYSPTNFEDDYTDDYRSRGLWVNFLAGGSNANPKELGLRIPIDLSLAFHSDAGITGTDSIIGTLAIYSTDKGTPLGDGKSRRTAADLASTVQLQIVNDIRQLMEPRWTLRKMKNSGYAEARTPKVPAMILESLSHQNRADMAYGLDPSFKFIMARAVYKGILRYIASRNGIIPVIQPLPINKFSITPAGTKERFILRWDDSIDPLEPSAKPSEYTIEKRTGNGAFVEVAKVTTKSWIFSDAHPDSLYSFRIIAENDGGRSFPSEILACGYSSNTSYWVNVVNAFTRTGAPEFLNDANYCPDNGVPWFYDTGYTGEIFDNNPSSQYTHNYSPGYGASRSNYTGTPVAGNTFDYPAVHGAAILEAGYSFFSQSLEAFMAPPDDYYEQGCIDLILGKQKESLLGSGTSKQRFKTFPAELQERLEIATALGTDLFVSGCYVATDLFNNPWREDSVKTADIKFAREILGIEWRTANATATGEAYTVPVTFKEFNPEAYYFNRRLNSESYAVDKSDSFAPSASTARIVMRYSENNLPAATAMRKEHYSTMVMGFPFEAINSNTARNNLMREILEFLTHSSP